MKTILKVKRLAIAVGASCLSTLVISTPALAGYSAIAQGVRGWGWASGYSSMERARNAAIQRCRQGGHGSCSVSTAEQDDWYFVGGYCDGVPYTAASPKNWEDAANFMRHKARKDGNFGCYIEVEK